METLLEIINSAILIVEKHQGLIKFANRKARTIFRDQTNSLTQTEFNNLFHPDNTIDGSKIINSCVIHGEFEGEVILKRFDNSYFVALISCSYLKDLENTFNREHIIVVVHDISRLKGMERLIRTSRRLAKLGELLDDINHQIRNPILTIGGLIKRLEIKDPINKNYYEMILKQCNKLETLLHKSDELINLSRPKPTPVYLKQFIEKTEESLENLSKELGLVLQYDYKFDNLERIGIFDLNTLNTIYSELLKNSLESYLLIDREPKVSIKIETLDDKRWSWTVSIKDWATGIKAQHLDKIFEPFFTTKTGHMGLGLTKIKMLLDEQVSKITVDSMEKIGTTFNIYVQKELRSIPRIPSQTLEKINKSN